jgi:hypothetical protein
MVITDRKMQTRTGRVASQTAFTGRSRFTVLQSSRPLRTTGGARASGEPHRQVGGGHVRRPGPGSRRRWGAKATVRSGKSKIYPERTVGACLPRASPPARRPPGGRNVPPRRCRLPLRCAAASAGRCSGCERTRSERPRGGHGMPGTDVVVVLAHAAWADGSRWNKVIAGLRSEGVKSVAAPLPLTTLDPHPRRR